MNDSKAIDVMIIVNDEVERLRMQAQADQFFYQLLKKDQPDQPSGLVNKPNPRREVGESTDSTNLTVF